MGNSASAARQAAKKGPSVVGNAAKSAAPAAKPRPPPLGRPSADAPEVIEDATKALKERQLKENQELMKPSSGPAPPQMPMPDENSGFYRGQISDPRDTAQAQFLAHQSGANLKAQQAPELSPDLLKFLQDMGPLEKKVNKVRTTLRHDVSGRVAYLT